MRRDSLQIGLALFWVVCWTAPILFNIDYYLRTEPGRRYLLFFGAMIFLGIAVFLYLFLRDRGAKAMYDLNRSKRCPDCYAKLRGEDFCPKCGKDLRDRDTSRICWNCGYEEVDKKSTSCPKCGRAYKK